MLKKYIALFEVGDHGNYSVVFPDLPGCITAGDDFDDAYKMAHDALTGHIHVLQKDGDIVPEPRTLEEIQKNWPDWDEWKNNYQFVIVPIALIPLQDKNIRIDVTIPSSLISRIDQVTNNRSAFLREAAEAMLKG